MMGLYLSSLRLDIKGVTLVVSLGWQSPIGRREVGPIWWPHGSVLFFLWDSGMNFQFFSDRSGMGHLKNSGIDDI